MLKKITSKHENGIFGKLKLVDEKVTHALGVINATFELVRRVSIRYPTNHRPFFPVCMGRGSRRRVVVGGRRRRWKEQVVETREGRSEGR